MNTIIDKLNENQRTYISYHDLYTICKEYLDTVKNSEIVDVESLVLSFGTFLEVVPSHRRYQEEWLNGLVNTLNDLRLNTYRTIYNDVNNENKCKCFCFGCLEYIGCISVELSETGMIYKYPIDRKIDQLTEKYFSSSKEDFREMYRIHDMMSEYFEHHSEQKYTKLYIDSLILGIYITIITMNINSSSVIKSFFVGYIKHLLRNERIQREQTKFIYGNYVS